MDGSAGQVPENRWVIWLGAGALTLGVGTAVIAGAPAASADSSSSAGTSSPAAHAGPKSTRTVAAESRPRSTESVAAVRPSSTVGGTGRPTVSRLAQTSDTASVGSLRRAGTPKPTPGPLWTAAASVVRQIQYTLFNKPPVVTSSQLATSATGAVTGSVNVLNDNGFRPGYAVSTPAALGTVTINDAGTYLYTPKAALASTGGTDSFTITVDNGTFAQAPGFLGAIQRFLHHVAQQLGWSGPDTSQVVVSVRLDPADVLLSDTPVGGEPPSDPAVPVLIAVGQGPVGVAVSPDGKHVYVANSAGNTVSVIDTASNSITATIPVGDGPVAVAVSPDSHFVYVANKRGGTVSVIDAVARQIIDTMPAGAAPTGIAVSADGTRIYVTTIDGTGGGVVVVFDGTDNSGVGAIRQVGDRPAGLAVSPDGTRLYVASLNGLAVVDTSLLAVVDFVDLPGQPYSVAINLNGQRVYVTGNGLSDVLSVIDTGSLDILETQPVGGGIGGLALSSDGEFLYLTSSVDNLLVAIDNDSAGKTISLLGSPTRVAVSPDGLHLYVTDYRANTVSVVDRTKL